MNFFDARRASLELRNPGGGIECRIRQLIHRQLLPPMVWNKDGVGTNCTDHQNRKNSVSAARDYPYSFAIADIEPRSRFRMDFHVRLRTLFDEKADAPRLIARQVLIDN